MNATDLPKQENFYKHYLRGYDGKQRVIVIISDAFRYECARELFGKLELDEKCTPKMECMLSCLPSVTSVGMASLLPHKGKDWNVGETKLIEKINQENRLIYYFTALNGLATKIIIQKDWAEYIVKNQQIIWGWLEYNMILYIQKRNPNVPGIADKLYPPKERKLEKIKNYWKLILSLEPIREIYGDEILTVQNISIDHFVPWSYVAHDEMWNLNPTTKSINSSKSNNLPDWDTYFKKLAQQEYHSYQLMWKNDIVHKEFEKCAKEHINSDDIRYRVYRRGLEYPVFAEELKSIILPVYQSAQNCGFGRWKY